MDEKKQFLRDFKKTVREEGAKLSNNYIIERIKKGDISESDLESFRSYIPRQLGIAIDHIMGVRRTTGILKVAKEVYDNRKLEETTPLKTILEMIKDNRVTQHDIQKIKQFTENKSITTELSKQIDKFFKDVLEYPSMPAGEQHRQKFKIEKMLRKRIVTLGFLERKANVKDIIKGIFKDEYKRYLSEEPYEKEIKEAIDEGLIQESNIEYLPDEYIEYYLKSIPKQDKTSFKKRRKASKSSYKQSLTKEDIEELTKDIIDKPTSKKQKTSEQARRISKDIAMISDEDLLNVIKDLESKKDVSKVTKKLESLNMMTKSKGTTRKSSIQNLRSKYIEGLKKQIKKDQEFSGLVKKEPVVKSMYSIERKLEDLKKGTKSRYLSKLDKTILAEDLAKRLGEMEIKGDGKKIDKSPVSPVGSISRSSSISSISSDGSLFTSKKRSRSSSAASSRRSSTGSVKSDVSKSSYKPEKEVKPKQIPKLTKIASTADSELDPESVKVISTFVNKSIAYGIGKKPKKEKSKTIVTDKESLMKYLEQEKEAKDRYIRSKKRKTDRSPPLSPYVPSESYGSSGYYS